MTTWLTILCIIAAVTVFSFLWDVPSALRGIHNELKRLNDREERK